jgi:alkylation response protein AidB-like acyl-CoA dehydrogenase
MIPNDEQRQLGEAAHTFLAEQAGPVAWRRTVAARPAHGFDPALWQQVAEMGWPAAVLPEAHGGLDFGWQGMNLVFQALGRHLACTPLLSSVVLGGGAVMALGDATQQAHWLHRLASGQSRLALALDERSRHAPGDLCTVAQPVAGGSAGWRLHGSKTLVLDALGADAYVVAADVPGTGLGLFLVDAGAPGLTIEATPLLDQRPVCRLRLDGVAVGAAGRLGQGSGSVPAGPGVQAALDRVLDRARLCLSAEALGLVDDVFARTLAYLKERIQFDVPIGSFQALQHRAARLYCDIELLRSAVMAGFEAIDAGAPDLPLLASLAKARASDLTERACNEAVQMHGGIGVTAEYDLGLYLKRGRVLAQTLGDAIFHRDRYAALKGF